jgi:hypothetical protein
LKLVIIFLLLISIECCGQTKSTSNRILLTLKYAGQYGYGRNVEKERIGYLQIFPETDSTVLFYMDLNRGAPSYNMGALYGRVRIVNDTGTFFIKFDTLSKGCKLLFHFSKSKIDISTDGEQDDCYFGNGVEADGSFKKYSNKTKLYFENQEGKKIYFIETKPESYYKDN